MATVQSMNLARLLALEADTVIGGHIDSSSHLILEQHDGSTIDAGQFTVDATTTIKGIAELATDAEAIAGTDTGRVVTPSNLAAVAGTFVPQASATVQGKVELATDAEATTGTDTVRAVTPSNLAAVAGTFVPQSTTTVQGKVELATTTEATTGTDTVRAVTPAGLKAAIDAVLQLIYPVGSYYISDSVGTNPNTLLGFGTWSAVQGSMLIGDDGSTFIHATTGGAQTHTLATGNLPSHSHAVGSLSAAANGTHTHSIGRDQSGATGSVERVLHSTGTSGAGQIFSGQLTSDGSHAHTLSGSTDVTGSGTAVNHMPPWRAVYMWRRTA